jgi:hypothetical protein
VDPCGLLKVRTTATSSRWPSSSPSASIAMGGGKSSDSTSTHRTPTAILIEQNDEWAVQRARYKTLETIAPLSDDPTVSLPAVAG